MRRWTQKYAELAHTHHIHRADDATDITRSVIHIRIVTIVGIHTRVGFTITNITCAPAATISRLNTSSSAADSAVPTLGPPSSLVN